ncbi:hypothetical protein ABZ348_34310 [Streptomyces sp. NPDC005963]|uniref:hypothetical protein n=1 Tax=Streptomyces sp. NPDC005963 TaxID=3156721 RepID=UPI0033D216BE
MSASRAMRAAGAWGHLLLVVLALGVFAMHTVGHPESSPEGDHGAMAAARSQGTMAGGSPARSGPTVEVAATIGVTGEPLTAVASGADSGAADAALEPGHTRGAGHHTTAVDPAVRHAAHLVPTDRPTGHATPPVDGSAAVPLELLAVDGHQMPATGHDEQAGAHHHGMVMDMASLCVAVLGSWILAALLRAALVRRSEWLPRLRAAALAALRPGAPPPRPHLTHLSVLRI